jgi:hypothetical protein
VDGSGYAILTYDRQGHILEELDSLTGKWTYYKDLRDNDYLLVDTKLGYRGVSPNMDYQGIGTTVPGDLYSLRWTDAIANDYLISNCQRVSATDVPVVWRWSLYKVIDNRHEQPCIIKSIRIFLMCYANRKLGLSGDCDNCVRNYGPELIYRTYRPCLANGPFDGAFRKFQVLLNLIIYAVIALSISYSLHKVSLKALPHFMSQGAAEFIGQYIFFAAFAFGCFAAKRYAVGVKFLNCSVETAQSRDVINH